MVHDAKIVGHRHPGIHAHVWARFLSDRQLRREIRAHLRVDLNLNPETNPQLGLLIQEAKQRPRMNSWLTCCLELLDANAAEDAKRAAEGTNIMAPGQHSRASS